MAETTQAVAAGEKPLVSLVSTSKQVVRAHRASSLLMLAPGVLGVLVAPFWVQRFGVTVLDLGLFLAMYWLTLGVGLSVGFHRHFTHGSFQTSAPLRWLLAVLGSMGAQGSLTYWVAVHRRHHELSDVEGDPHSPNLAGRGIAGTLRGLWHGHYGWSLSYGLPNAMHYCPDLARVPYLAAVNRNYRKWVLAGLLLPGLVGGLVTWTWTGAFGGLLWAGSCGSSCPRTRPGP